MPEKHPFRNDEMNKIYAVILSLLCVGTCKMTPNDLSFNMHHTHFGTFATTEPGIGRSYLINEFRVCATEIAANSMRAYLKELAGTLNFTLLSPDQSMLVFPNENPADNEYNLEGMLRAKEGGVRAYYWRKPQLLTVTIEFHDKKVSPSSIAAITKQHFGLIESTELTLKSENIKQQNSKVEVRTDHELGRGVFAKEDIKKGEFVGGLYGKFHEAKDCMSLPEEYRDHVMQCADHFWRGNETPQEAVQYLNHSCDPNCGVQGLFDFVAMRDIKAGEELTTDYAMQDDSNWVVPGGKCLCGAQNCRGDILPYGDLTQKEKEQYKNYVSHWILHRYKICSCAQ